MAYLNFNAISEFLGQITIRGFDKRVLIVLKIDHKTC